jgi:homopolymeric O-antigen transport system permease protein
MTSVPDRARVPAAAQPRWTWLALSFARREITNRYAGSVSGLAWTLLHPLAQLAIYAFVFSQVFRVALPPEYAGAAYTTFVALALWPWIMFTEGVQRAMGSIGANAGLIRKVAFPHRLLVYAAVLASVAVHSVGFVAVIVVLKAMGEPLRLSALPLAFILLVPYMLLAAGLGAALAAFQTMLRDVEHAVGIVLAMVLYASPILYPASLVPASLHWWLEVNPVAWFSERMREVLIGGSGLVAGDLVAAAGCAAAFAAGLWVFNRISPHFEDFL